MRLREFDQHDHPEANPFLPQVGCGICGRAVQPEVSQEHWDDVYPAQQEEALEAMSAWSFAHADAHSPAEHQDHQDRLDGSAG